MQNRVVDELLHGLSVAEVKVADMHDLILTVSGNDRCAVGRELSDGANTESLFYSETQSVGKGEISLISVWLTNLDLVHVVCEPLPLPGIIEMVPPVVFHLEEKRLEVVVHLIVSFRGWLVIIDHEIEIVTGGDIIFNLSGGNADRCQSSKFY